MRAALNTAFVAILMSAGVLAAPARAQTTPDVAGHWEGVASTDLGAQNLGVDIGRRADRSLRGAMSSDGLNSLALATISQEGPVLRFAIGSGFRFEGRLTADGQAIEGYMDTPQGVVSVKLARKGEPEFAPEIVSARIDPALEGVWEGALDALGRHLRIRLTLANRSDGHADATMASLDEGLDLPATVTSSGMRMTLTVPAVDGTWDGELKDGQLVGAYAQRGMSFPLTLQRAKN